MYIQKNLYSLLAGTVLLGSGCTTINKVKNYVKGGETYAHNAASHLKANQFSDRDFNTSRSEVRMPFGTYIFGKLKVDDNIEISGSVINADDLFPYWGLRKDKMTEYVSPGKKEAYFGRDDAMGSVFVRAHGIEKIITDRCFEPQEMPKNKEVANVGESHFGVPGINFENRDIKHSLGYVVYTAGKDKAGKPTQILMLNPVFGLDHEKGLVVLYGTAYEEKKAKIPSLKYSLATNDIVNAQIIWK